MGVTWTLQMQRLNTLEAVLEPRATAILDKTAFDVVRLAVPLAAIDTGAMRASIYVAGASGGPSYGNAAAAAQRLRPGAQVGGEVAPANKFERVIGAAVEYALWQELKRPYLTPALLMVAPAYEAAWGQLLK